MIRTSASISVQFDNIFSPYAGEDWVKGFEWVKKAGFDAVEIILSDPELLDVEKIKSELDRLSLKVSTVSTGQAMGVEGISMCSPSQYLRKAARERLFADIDFAAAIGNPNVTVGLIRGRGGEQKEFLERKLLLRELKEAAAYGREKGIVINLEPINRYECRLINSTKEGYDLLGEMGYPENIGILYDTFHSNIEDPDMLEAIRTYGPYISHVHFADSNRQIPGDGHIDFRQICKTLESVGYQGYVSLEVLNRPDALHVIKDAKEAMSVIQ